MSSRTNSFSTRRRPEKGPDKTPSQGEVSYDQYRSELFRAAQEFSTSLFSSSPSVYTRRKTEKPNKSQQEQIVDNSKLAPSNVPMTKSQLLSVLDFATRLTSIGEQAHFFQAFLDPAPLASSSSPENLAEVSQIYTSPSKARSTPSRTFFIPTENGTPLIAYDQNTPLSTLRLIQEQRSAARAARTQSTQSSPLAPSSSSSSSTGTTIPTHVLVTPARLATLPPAPEDSPSRRLAFSSSSSQPPPSSSGSDAGFIPRSDTAELDQLIQQTIEEQRRAETADAQRNPQDDSNDEEEEANEGSDQDPLADGATPSERARDGHGADDADDAAAAAGNAADSPGSPLPIVAGLAGVRSAAAEAEEEAEEEADAEADAAVAADAAAAAEEDAVPDLRTQSGAGGEDEAGLEGGEAVGVEDEEALGTALDATMDAEQLASEAAAAADDAAAAEAEVRTELRDDFSAAAASAPPSADGRKGRAVKDLPPDDNYDRSLKDDCKPRRVRIRRCRPNQPAPNPSSTSSFSSPSTTSPSLSSAPSSSSSTSHTSPPFSSPAASPHTASAQKAPSVAPQLTEEEERKLLQRFASEEYGEIEFDRTPDDMREAPNQPSGEQLQDEESDVDELLPE